MMKELRRGQLGESARASILQGIEIVVRSVGARSGRGVSLVDSASRGWQPVAGPFHTSLGPRPSSVIFDGARNLAAPAVGTN